jgi:ABC-2 type transport system permease protein
VNVSGVWAVVAVEWSKQIAQLRMRIVVAACVISPWLFLAAMRSQSMVPEDTLFGRAVNESGFATPLVVLGFATLWVLPVLASFFAGDMFASEDRFGTWTMVLTRSRSRAEMFSGKLIGALSFATLAIVMLAGSSLAAGVLVVGHQPLIDLSGALLTPGSAIGSIAAAWVSVLPPSFAFAALAVVISVATRNGAAGIGIPVVVALLMQLSAYLNGPEVLRPMLITSAFGAWHGLLTHSPYYRPLIYGTAASAAYFAVCAASAYSILRRRDITG